MPPEHDLPPDLRWICRTSATSLVGPNLEQQMDALAAAVPRLARAPRGPARVLRVDDNPTNNEYERSMLRHEGLIFDNVVSSTEAIDQLLMSTYALAITDLGRRWSSDRSQGAGHELLKHPVITNGGPASRRLCRQECRQAAGQALGARCLRGLREQGRSARARVPGAWTTVDRGDHGTENAMNFAPPTTAG